jgi:hypothetical protein
MLRMLQEHSGSYGLMRVMAFNMQINAIALSWYVVCTGKADQLMVGIFLTVAFGGKATQKFIENKYPCPLNTTEEGSKK